jgi:hypothetical protein
MRVAFKCILYLFTAFVVLIALGIVGKLFSDEETAGEDATITYNVSYERPSKSYEDDSKLIYADSKEEAIAKSDELENYPYMKSVDDVVWEDENEQYAAMFYHTVKIWRWEGIALCKFKIRKIDDQKQYALTKIYVIEAHTNWFRSDPLDTVQTRALAFDIWAKYSIEDGKRFFWGSLGTEKVKTLKIEGQSPTGIVEYTLLGEPEYFWYYEDIDSDKRSSDFTIEMEEED